VHDHVVAQVPYVDLTLHVAVIVRRRCASS
jgi:hypothetical protein